MVGDQHSNTPEAHRSFAALRSGSAAGAAREVTLGPQTTARRPADITKHQHQRTTQRRLRVTAGHCTVTDTAALAPLPLQQPHGRTDRPVPPRHHTTARPRRSTTEARLWWWWRRAQPAPPADLDSPVGRSVGSAVLLLVVVVVAVWRCPGAVGAGSPRPQRSLSSPVGPGAAAVWTLDRAETLRSAPAGGGRSSHAGPLAVRYYIGTNGWKWPMLRCYVRCGAVQGSN